jgi:hypothetical protein
MRSIVHVVRFGIAATSVVAAATLSLVVSPVAHAGTYVVYSCHTPSGAYASTEGWTPEQSAGAGDAVTDDDCQNSGVDVGSRQLVASVNDFIPGEARAGNHSAWVFNAPAGTTIASGHVNICGEAQPVGGTLVAAGPSDDWTAPGMTSVVPKGGYAGELGCIPGTTFDPNPINGPRFAFSAWCTSEPCSNGSNPYAAVYIPSAVWTLRDDHPPAVVHVSGSLANGVPEHDRLSATYDATDVGSGLYRVLIEAKINQSGDWRTLATQPVDDLHGRCEPAGETSSPYEFLVPQPCRLSVADAPISFDTSILPAGDHLLRVEIEDASGGLAEIVPPRILHIDEPAQSTPLSAGTQPPPPNNGHGASARALVQMPRAKRTVKFGRHVDVTGHLVDEKSHPIADAEVQVDWRRLAPRRGPIGGGWRALGSVRTDSHGRFVARIPSGTSRLLRFAYRANLAQGGFTSSAEFRVITRAHASLRAARRTVHNGRAAVFHGRVAGPVPAGGVPVTLQAWVGGRGWTPARTRPANPRTGAKGRFTVSYRFGETFRPTRYIFRVVVGPDSGYAFARGGSRHVHVLVRP